MPTMSEVLLHITHHLNRFRVRHCMPRRLPQRVVDPPAGVHRSLCHLHPYKEEPVSEFKRYAEIYQRVIPLFQSRRFRTFPQGPGPIPRVRGLHTDMGQQSHPSSSGQHGLPYNDQQDVYDQRSLYLQVGVDPQQVLQMQNVPREHVHAIERPGS
jgi:hypothetical protein